MAFLQEAASAPAAAQNGEQAAAPKHEPEGIAQQPKREADPGGGSDGDSDVVIVEDGALEEGTAADSSCNGFYRAARETGRANILLALQVRAVLLICKCEHQGLDKALERSKAFPWGHPRLLQPGLLEHTCQRDLHVAGLLMCRALDHCHDVHGSDHHHVWKGSDDQ